LPESRILSSAFLETILLKDKYRRALTRRGVRIVGARFAETLDLENAELGHELWLDQSLLERGANFSRLRSTQLISFQGAKVTGELNMVSLQVARSLFMRNTELAEVNLGSAHVGGTLELSRSKVTGRLYMDKLSVASSLLMRNAEFAEVNLGSAHIGGTLELSRSKVTGRLYMDKLSVASSLFMRNAEFAEVNLGSAHVGGSLQLSRSKVTGTLNMFSVQVDRTVLLSRGADFVGPVDCFFAKFANLELAGGSFHADVDITGTQILGELLVGSSLREAPQWSKKSTLILRNVRVDSIQDLPNAWPPHLDLNGFIYRNLGGLAATGDSMANRSIEWFNDWLGKQKLYTPAPYEQLAAVLRSQGRLEAADEILFAKKEHERAQASFLSYISLTATKWLIGYGHHLWWALFWVAGLLIVGMATLRLSGEGPRNGMPYGIAYSFDMLLPIIRLREEHYKMDLAGWTRYYFYGHKIAGYVLASFLIAGIAGLTK
jgi:hypothetical protein